MRMTMSPIWRLIATGTFASLAIVSLACAQIRLVGAADADWDADWTVLTIAPNGAWGAATEGALNRAIARAIARCHDRDMAKEGGCGAYQISVRRRFALALRCGVENILAEGTTLDEARKVARKREDNLRRNYHPDMASCRQIVTVAPDGAVMVARQLISSDAGGRRQ